MIGDNSPAWLILSGGYRASSAERLTWLEPDDEAHDARIAKYEAKCQSDHDARLARDEARREAQAVKSAELARAKVLRGQLSRRRQRVRKAEDGTRRRAPLSPERRQAIALAMRAVWKARKQGARQLA